MESESELAVRAACNVAERHGLRFDRAVVLRDSSNLLVHLAPARVVARVATNTAIVRQGPAWLQREVAVVSHLAAAGAPVVAPAAELPPGPHASEGYFLTFSQFVVELDQPLDPARAGHALQACHEALADFAGELPRWAPLNEAEKRLKRLTKETQLSETDAALLERTLSRHQAAIESLTSPIRPVHGDAHLANVLTTEAGPLWNDWEDTFAGPLSWDLACLVSRWRVYGMEEEDARRAFEAYGHAVDERELDLLVELRAVYVILWSAMIAVRQGRTLDHLDARFGWLRARDRGQ